MQALPIGIQDFEKLRERGYLYVDKTREIRRLITCGGVFFLSRPRRFGKSLLVSTLEAIFQGKKALFEGLYIYDKIDWNDHYPVIRLDWSDISHESPEEMKQGTAIYVKRIASEYGITLEQAAPVDRFSELIWALHRKTGKQAVVLIDEYDKPILDSLHKAPEELDAMREFLRAFYGVLKSSDGHLRFVFLTGVSKFSKVSIFSELNNTRDITLSNDFVTICGYTPEELESRFAPFIEEMAETQGVGAKELLQQIQAWYNGFSWDGIHTVYNPFSTLLLFTEKVLRNYWFESGTPAFLINIIKQRNDVKLLLEPSRMQDMEFNSFDYKTLDTKLLLFQTGYLTVKRVETDPFGVGVVYTLGMPNEEVRQSMIQHLVTTFAEYPAGNTVTLRNHMMKQLFDGDASGLEASLKELFAHIPYQLHIPKEAYYHSLLLLWLNLLSFKVEAEVSTDKGRIDAVWTWEDRVVIAEVKYASKGTVEPLIKKALTQVRKQCYQERYAGTNRRIALLAVALAGKKIGCRIAELQ